MPLIVYIPFWLFLPYNIPCNGNSLGVYVESEQTAYVCEWAWKLTENHEIGHYHWNRLTDKQREQYRALFKKHLALYEKNQSIWWKYFYRYYGLTSAEEDFAENYALLVEWKRHPIMLQQRINLVHKFLN